MKFQEFTLILSIITLMFLTAIGGQTPQQTFDYSTIKDLQEEREDREEKCSKFTKDDYKKCPFSEVLGE